MIQFIILGTITIIMVSRGIFILSTSGLEEESSLFDRFCVLATIVVSVIIFVLLFLYLGIESLKFIETSLQL